MSVVRFLAAVSTWRRVGLLSALAGVVALAACGGNVSRSEPYVPTRLVAFGDENSAFSSDGHKYTINGVNSAATFDCSLNPNWVQYVASGYGFTFQQCPGAATPPYKAESRAVAGATINDVVTQVANYGGGFDNATLVTVMAGQNDVQNAFEAVVANSLTESGATALMTAQGTKLGQLVNQITASGAGGRVLLALAPNIGYSPYAIAQEAARPGSQALLKNLTNALNLAAQLAINDNGRWAALIYDKVPDIVAFPSAYGVGDTTTAGCIATLPNCEYVTGQVSSTSTAYLWADATRIGPQAHGQVGSLALTRARNNPF